MLLWGWLYVLFELPNSFISKKLERQDGGECMKWTLSG